MALGGSGLVLRRLGRGLALASHDGLIAVVAACLAIVPIGDFRPVEDDLPNL